MLTYAHTAHKTAPEGLIRPVNGVDVSTHSGPIAPPAPLPSWMRVVGMKATHLGSANAPGGIDPTFRDNRLSFASARWRVLFHWVTPNHPAAQQMGHFATVIGPLHRGECVELDFEQDGVTGALIDECIELLHLTYGDRVMVYVNDNTAETKTWIEANRRRYGLRPWVPIWHPNYSPTGMATAKGHGAAVWQSGQAMVTPHPMFTRPVSVNLVLRPDELDDVCGL